MGIIKSRNPPGRFLEFDSHSGSWGVADKERAIEKACQALRDKRCNQEPLETIENACQALQDKICNQDQLERGQKKQKTSPSSSCINTTSKISWTLNESASI